MPFRQLTRSPQAGFTLVEVLLVVTIIGTLSAIAVPSLTRARGAAYEVSTVGLLRAIHSGQVSFSAACGAGYYAPSIPWLATKPKGSMAPFIGPEVKANSTDRQGYRIRFTVGRLAKTAPATCNGLGKGAAANTYFVAADLLATKNGMVSRYFGVNPSGVIFQSTKRVPVTQTGAPPAPAIPIR